MTSHPSPHSPEWFQALERFDAGQAAHTRQIIALAGGRDVCSVCGDRPAPAYQILKVKFAEGAVATIRLCDDCRDIRRELHGEDFIEFTETGHDRRN
jgi:hypothetical protein